MTRWHNSGNWHKAKRLWTPTPFSKAKSNHCGERRQLFMLGSRISFSGFVPWKKSFPPAGFKPWKTRKFMVFVLSHIKMEQKPKHLCKIMKNLSHWFSLLERFYINIFKNMHTSMYTYIYIYTLDFSYRIVPSRYVFLSSQLPSESSLLRTSLFRWKLKWLQTASEQIQDPGRLIRYMKKIE